MAKNAVPPITIREALVRFLWLPLTVELLWLAALVGELCGWDKSDIYAYGAALAFNISGSHPVSVYTMKYSSSSAP